MIVGSGLLATAFSPRFATDPRVMIYAAGVSNSSCKDDHEFQRERVRLLDALDRSAGADAFVYFSTCSIDDPASAESLYVRHKADMERLVSAHRRPVVARLPQVAGRTPNPHTLLNYIYARIVRSESFTAWRGASRNVIDVDDVERTLAQVVADPSARGVTLNVANPQVVRVSEIVQTFERVLGKVAVVDWVDTGATYAIDVQATLPIYHAAGIQFPPEYLYQVLEKYYG